MKKGIDTEINVEFQETLDRQELQSGEEIKTLFGKIKKWLSDLKAVAFSGSYNDLSDKPNIDDKVDKVSGKGLSTNDFTTAEKNKLSGLENYDDSEIKSRAAINRGTLGYQAKNLLMNNCKSFSNNGVTATVNNDGSITFTGSNTDDKFILYWNMQTGSTISNYTDNKKWLPNGRYIVSGGHDGVSIQVCWSENNDSDDILARSQSGNEAIFTVTDAHKYLWSRVYIVANADFSEPVTVYPMIRCAEITDDTYEPYKPSVEERLAAIESKIAEENKGA